MYGKGPNKVLKGIMFNFKIPAYTLYTMNENYKDVRDRFNKQGVNYSGKSIFESYMQYNVPGQYT